MERYLLEETIEKRILFESTAEYKKRIEAALQLIGGKHADNIIASMRKRCDLVLKAKGARIKY